MKQILFNKPYMPSIQKDKFLKKNHLENICLISRYLYHAVQNCPVCLMYQGLINKTQQ